LISVNDPIEPESPKPFPASSPSDMALVLFDEYKSPFPTVLHRGGELLLPFGNWVLVDMNGRALWKGTFADNRLRMDVVPGIYFIRNERKAVQIIVID